MESSKRRPKRANTYTHTHLFKDDRSALQLGDAHSDLRRSVALVLATTVVMLLMLLMLRMLRGGRQSQRVVAHEKRDLVAARRLIVWIDAFVEREEQVFVAIRAPNQRG